MSGKPVIRGTRITVDLILELLAAGTKPEEIAEDYVHNNKQENVRPLRVARVKASQKARKALEEALSEELKLEEWKAAELADHS
jgi:hypothetical protein